jgi:hypothetical protein
VPGGIWLVDPKAGILTWQHQNRRGRNGTAVPSLHPSCIQFCGEEANAEGRKHQRASRSPDQNDPVG